MSNPTGTFTCKLDAKGRLMLPADFREQLGNQVDEDFVLRPGLHGDYLELYTNSDWNRRKEILMQVNTFDRRKLDVIRKYLDGVKRVKLDASGRLQIPKELVDRHGFTKDIVINSMFTNMEIWDKTKYDERVNSITDEELAQSVENIFSGLNFGI
jgi:MraZ protein